MLSTKITYDFGNGLVLNLPHENDFMGLIGSYDNLTRVIDHLDAISKLLQQSRMASPISNSRPTREYVSGDGERYVVNLSQQLVDEVLRRSQDKDD